MPKIITHPNNRAILADVARKAKREHRPFDAPALAGADPLEGWPIHFNEYVPERQTETVWHPPAGDRFAEYDSTDEVWMRPLLEWTGDPQWGRLETVDLGPGVWVVNDVGLDAYLFPRGPLKFSGF